MDLGKVVAESGDIALPPGLASGIYQPDVLEAHFLYHYPRYVPDLGPTLGPDIIDGDGLDGEAPYVEDRGYQVLYVEVWFFLVPVAQDPQVPRAPP